MDLIKDPCAKDAYNTCKYRVKLWEHEFKKKYRRLPSRLDIREAEKEVRLAYKTYFNLKSAALEQSFIDVDGFQSEEEEKNEKEVSLSSAEELEIGFKMSSQELLNGLEDDNIGIDKTWDEHLNKKKQEMTKNSSPELLNRLEDSNINTDETWGEHLNKKELEKTKKTSQKLLKGFEDDNVSTDETWGKHLNNKRDSPKPEKKQMQSKVNLSFSQKLYDRSKFSKRNPRKSMSFHRRKSETNRSEPKSLSQPAYSALCLESENKTELSLSLFQEDLLNLDNCKVISEKSHVSTQPVNVINSILDNEYKLRKTVDAGWVNRITQKTGADFGCDNVIVEDFSFSRGYIQEKATKLDSDDDDVIENSDDESQLSQSVLHIAKKMRTDPKHVSNNSITKTNRNKDVVSPVNKSDNVKNNSDLEGETCRRKNGLTDAKYSARKVVPKKKQNSERKSIQLKKNVCLEEDSDSGGDGSYNKDPEFEVIATKTKKVEEYKIEIRNTDSPIYELEYSVQPRIMTAPRVLQMEKIASLKSRDTNEKAKEKLTERGNLNENFVRINLKKKVFARGKKSLNFGKYKKQMWKKRKSDGSSFEGKSVTCFSCNQIGHFARQCPNVKSDGLLPLSADNGEDDEYYYPTLEEAAQVAQESVLAIRKPNMASVTNKNSELSSTDMKTANSEEAFEDSECEEQLLAEVLQLEKQIDMKQYVDTTSIVKPYYEADNFTVIELVKKFEYFAETPTEVVDVLEMFGHTKFRLGQERAIMRILSGKSTLVTMSTGSGKSLCYQLPAYLYSQREPCLSLVISPLVSLMEDQVMGISPFLKAACLHTNQTKAQRGRIMESIASGNLNVLLVSPEAIVAGDRTTGFSSILRKLPPIAFACIDEAHCVSQWSHNFRPSYLMICRILRERLGINTVLGLTATATRSTCESIIHHLRVPDGLDGIISDVPLPDNLRLTVSSDLNRDGALLGLLSSDRFTTCKSIIVYCTRRDECERIAAFLRTSLKYERPANNENKKRKRISMQAEPYHAGMSASRRRTVQKAFMSGELRIVVATVAFGMGINKPDIRAVIHYNMPGSFEGYVQEVGRAGRDGLPAHCHLFLDSQGKDENELRRHVHANSVDRHVIRKLLQKIFVPCVCTGACPKHEVGFSIQETVQALDLPEEIISTLLCYLELHENRYIQVLSPAYTDCKVISYAGPKQIKRAAKDCPPLAMALALFKKPDENVFEFPIVDVASAIGWDSGICKHKLKNLEWTDVNNQPKRSPLSVQFSNLGFHLLAPGNLPDSELDNALDSLYCRVIDQEQKCLSQLHAFSATVKLFAQKCFRSCTSDETTEKEKNLKDRIRLYFENPKPLDDSIHPENPLVNEDAIATDTRSLIHLYRDTAFTGRAVARVFHGIQSPNFPAFIWGRCKFWRAHMHEDFHAVCKIATREILKMR